MPVTFQTATPRYYHTGWPFIVCVFLRSDKIVPCSGAISQNSKETKMDYENTSHIIKKFKLPFINTFFPPFLRLLLLPTIRLPYSDFF